MSVCYFECSLGHVSVILWLHTLQKKKLQESIQVSRLGSHHAFSDTTPPEARAGHRKLAVIFGLCGSQKKSPLPKLQEAVGLLYSPQQARALKCDVADVCVSSPVIALSAVVRRVYIRL